jgi:TatD related DNase
MRAAARGAGVERCVIPAVEAANWGAVRTLAQRWGDVYCLGIHPLYVPQAQETDLAELRAEVAARRADPHLAAVGEIGLDFFVPALCTPAMRDKQERFYQAQLRIAAEFEMPVVLHVRRSADRLLKQLRSRQGAGAALRMLLMAVCSRRRRLLTWGSNSALAVRSLLTGLCSCVVWPRRCLWSPWCWRPMHPIFRRTGCTPRCRTGSAVRSRASTRHRKSPVSRKWWRNCVVSPWQSCRCTHGAMRATRCRRWQCRPEPL